LRLLPEPKVISINIPAAEKIKVEYQDGIQRSLIIQPGKGWGGGGVWKRSKQTTSLFVKCLKNSVVI